MMHKVSNSIGRTALPAETKPVGIVKMLPVPCPCCGQSVAVPSLDVLLDRRGIKGLQANIMSVIWRGKGMPVSSERIFDAMYRDDPDGGPSRVGMYRSLKAAMHLLRLKIKGSGISIESAGYGRGFRLVMGDAAPKEK